MADESPPQDGRIDSVFRNGSMTVVGVLTAFSLGILTQWTDDPTPWHWIDLIVVAPMVAGTAAQLIAMKRLLHPDSLDAAIYTRAIRLFLWGLSLLAAGVLLGVMQDAASAISQAR
jgi:hypothetical protein